MFKNAFLSLLLVAAFGFVDRSGAVIVGTYVLDNHPDGAEAPPLYGLRLDGLLGGNNVTTFDVTKNANNPTGLLLDYSAGGIHIYGQVYGGVVEGSSFKNPELWTIDFSYKMVTSVPGDDDVWTLNTDTSVQGNALFGMGTMTRLNGDVYQLKDQSNGSFSFRLGDEDNDQGHRGFAGISGWGWLDYKRPGGKKWKHIGSDDWLFTASLAPTAASMPDGVGVIPESMLGLAALLGFALFARRKAIQVT